MVIINMRVYVNDHCVVVCYESDVIGQRYQLPVEFTSDLVKTR
jgi:hypothetical protein